MTPKRKHALLSPSSSERWLACPPSARLSELYPEGSPSLYAVEGTAAHTLAEYRLAQALGRPALDPIPSLNFYNAAMEEHVDNYVKYVMQLAGSAPAPTILTEQRLDFSRYVPEGTGIGDCLLVIGQTLHVIDFKYGQGVLVQAHDNPQLKLYALGALELLDPLHDLETLQLTVYQPRRENLDTYTLSKAQLYQWVEEVLTPTAALAFAGLGEYRSGEHCRFCPASVDCRARAEEKLQLARLEFAPPARLTEAEIEEVLKQLDDLVNWANAVKEYALQAAVHHHKQWPGFKLVAGRAQRRYLDEAAVAATAQAAGYQDLYKQELRSITEMETMMGKATFQKVLGHLVEKPSGKPTLVPLSDKRPALSSSEFQKEELSS